MKRCKRCKSCKEEKPLSEFYKSGKYYQSKCKPCHLEYYKPGDKYHKYKDSFYSVYYIPEHHYVGMTSHISRRMTNHRRLGKMTEGMEIIARFERAVDAHYLETLLHMRGYNGFRS